MLINKSNFFLMKNAYINRTAVEMLNSKSLTKRGGLTLTPLCSDYDPGCCYSCVFPKIAMQLVTIDDTNSAELRVLAAPR